MPGVKIDYSKLLGFRLVSSDQIAVQGAKIGQKGGIKLGKKIGEKPGVRFGAKLGFKDGTKGGGR